MSQPVAIVGLSLRYPGFCGPAAFFDSCRSVHSRLVRFKPEEVRPYLADHPRGQSHPYRINNVQYGSIRDMSWIDSARFRVPPSDIDGDPSPFLCLQVASEALLDHCRDRGQSFIPKERTGVVIGRGDHPHRGLWSGLQGGSGFELLRELLLERRDLFTENQVDAVVETLLERMRPYPSPSIAASLVSNVISGLVANRLDLQGPNFLVDAACASAIVAIQQAVRSLEHYETDLMLVGAVQATMSVPIIQMFSMIGAISNDDVQPFNRLLDGTLLSEGVGFIVLKRLDDARRDGDRIYSVIRGFGLASDGNDSSILAPSSRGQILSMRRAYDSLSGIAPDEIGYLEAHATGINLGDETELASVREVFAPERRRRPLALGALKSLIGHSIPASGMAAVIRASYAVAYGMFPGSRCDQPLQEMAGDGSGLFLPDAMAPWYELPSVPRRAAVNCFGFGGINGHVVLEQASICPDERVLQWSGILSKTPSTEQSASQALTSLRNDQAAPLVPVSARSPVHVICLSFQDENELQQIVVQALDTLETVSDEESSCLQFGVAGSLPGTYRLGLVESDLDSVKKSLQYLLDHPDHHSRWSQQVLEKVPSLAVMLPGEALIPFGHLLELARHIPGIKSVLEIIDSASTDGSILADLLHPAWSHLLSDNMKAELQSQVNHHDSATKVLFAVSVVYAGMLRFLGVEPDGFIGHSTGEINALMLAGGLQCDQLDDVRTMLQAFDSLYSDSRYTDRLQKGTVVLVSGLSDISISECLEQQIDLFLISDNSPSHRLLFSPSHSFNQLADIIASYGGFVLPTQLDRAYHTSLFAEGAEVMRSFYENFQLRELNKKVYSCCSTEAYPDQPSDQRDLLVQQWVEPVRFRQALENMYRDGYRCFLELNASRTLIGFAESSFYGIDDVTLLSTGSSKSTDAIESFALSVMSLWLKGFAVQWDRWDHLFQYNPDFELPLIERPRGAVSISHDLHRFEPKDYQDAWGETDAVATPPHSASLKEKKLSEIDFIHQHQDTMRKALDSMNKNTQLIFKQLNSSTKSQS